MKDSERNLNFLNLRRSNSIVQKSVFLKGSQHYNQIISYLPVISMYLLGEHFDEAE